MVNVALEFSNKMEDDSNHDCDGMRGQVTHACTNCASTGLVSEAYSLKTHMKMLKGGQKGIRRNRGKKGKLYNISIPKKVLVPFWIPVKDRKG